MQMTITPRQAYRTLRLYDAGMNDPMTQHYGAGEHVTQMFYDKMSRQGTSFEELAELATAYRQRREAKRFRFKDPVRLAWKARQSERRHYLHHSPF